MVELCNKFSCHNYVSGRIVYMGATFNREECIKEVGLHEHWRIGLSREHENLEMEHKK